MDTLAPVTEAAMSYSGPWDGKGYTGLFILPGDVHWRTCKDTAGQTVFHPTIAEAEADAGHRLVAALNRKDAA